MKRYLVASVFVLVAIGFGVFVANRVYAADFDISLDTNVEVTAFDKLTNVDTRITFTNNVDSETPDSITLPAFGQDIKSLLAVYSDDDGVIEASYDENNNTIFVPLIRSNKGTGNVWSIDVTYASENTESLGDTHITMLEGYPKMLGDFEITSEKRTIISDLSLGIGTRIGMVAPESSVGIGVQNLTWTEEGPITFTTGVVFGDVALANAEIETKLENNSIFFKNFTVVLAPDDNQQRVYVDSIEPAPRNVKVDVDGNILAEYRVGPFSSLEVKAEATILVDNFTYDFSVAQDKLTDEEKEELSTSLVNTERWPAQNFPDVDAADPDVELIQQIIDETLKQDLDDFGSDEFSQIIGRNDYFVGALRGYDIPARALRGKLTTQAGQQSYAWAEVFVGGMGWITVDSMSASKSFRTADARYVALLTRNQSDSFPPSRINDTKISYVEGAMLPESDEKPIVASRTYMILPGLGLRISSVKMPPGIVIDNTALLIEGDRLVDLGSVAPLQTITTRDPVWGSNALNTTKVSFGTVDDEGSFSAVADVDSTVSWKPFIGLVILSLLSALGYFLWKRRKPSNKPKKPKKAKRSKRGKPSSKSHAAIQAQQEKLYERAPAPKAAVAKPVPKPQPSRKPVAPRPPAKPKPSTNAYKTARPSTRSPRKKPPTLIQ